MTQPAARAYWITWVMLLALLVLTFALAHVRLGNLNAAVSLAIGAMKALLVALVFMKLRRASTLLAVFAVAGLLALAILFGLSGADYATRATTPAPWTSP
ncbi:MAG TPA: cytochrome C oxidase subunit IV family protein [Usitatibacter sp.]|jgi:cytochrome c oxidase subunit 4|nr:cytochrome C oxidase subunit IV family protein [Usitatibacter sp.]